MLNEKENRKVILIFGEILLLNKTRLRMEFRNVNIQSINFSNFTLKYTNIHISSNS